MREVYIITNADASKIYKVVRQNSESVRHWCINHLDMSEVWTYAKENAVSRILYNAIAEKQANSI
jgi:hypothetical protein